MTKQPVTLTMPDPDIVRIAIGPEAFDLPVSRIKEIWNGTRYIEILLFQFHVALQQAGVNPNTATPAQIKSTLEAQTYWWGA